MSQVMTQDFNSHGHEHSHDHVAGHCCEGHDSVMRDEATAGGDMGPRSRALKADIEWLSEGLYCISDLLLRFVFSQYD